MKVVAAGTGPPDGLPVPGCPCRTCRRMRRDGITRAPGELWLEPENGARVVLTASRGETVYGGVLWAPDAAQLDAAALRTGSIGLALVGPGRSGDLIAVARAVAALRSGPLTEGAECVLIGATHNSPQPERREMLLHAWDITEAADGQEWVLPITPRRREGLGRVLVIGGAASGKSQLAEDLLAADPSVTYLATGPVAAREQDADWAARVRRHQRRRPRHWHTVETGSPLGTLAQTREPMLLDSLGSWLTGVLDRSGAWDDAAGWRTRAQDEMAGLAGAWRRLAGTAIAVTEEVGWGVVPETAAGRLFRDLLGRLNQAIAQESDRVIVVVAGQLMQRRGDSP